MTVLVNQNSWHMSAEKNHRILINALRILEPDMSLTTVDISHVRAFFKY